HQGEQLVRGGLGELGGVDVVVEFDQLDRSVRGADAIVQSQPRSGVIDQGKPTGQAARTTTDDQRSRTASKAKNPPLVRVGLTVLLGLLLRFRLLSCSSGRE